MLYGIKQIMIDKRRLKLILGILFIFLVTNVCFADFNWKLMGKAGNGDKYFIDLSSIQKHKQMRNYIRLRDYAITDSHGENSSIITLRQIVKIKLFGF
ncbi:MAG: hypothetical protein CMM91_06595 [Rickettsiales bacterium]|nr:hypothetical protein [Rickettsiales bacterium]